MRNFGSIVGGLVLAMDNRRHDLPFCCTIASEFVRRHFNRDAFSAFQQLAEEALRSAFILAALHNDIDLWAQVMGARRLRAARSGSSSRVAGESPLPRLAGVTRARWLLWGQSPRGIESD